MGRSWATITFKYKVGNLRTFKPMCYFDIFLLHKGHINLNIRKSFCSSHEATNPLRALYLYNYINIDDIFCSLY